MRDLTEQERALERAQLRSELLATIETTGRLASVLQAARRGRDPMYVALGGLLMGHLGWRDVAVNVRRGAERVVEWTSDSATELLGARYERESFAPYLAKRFDRGGAFFSREEDGVLVSGPVIVVGGRDPDDPDAPRAGDGLFVPVPDGEGGVRAIVSVDRPGSGKRPTDTELRALGAIGSHVGLAYELLDAAELAVGATPDARA